MERTDLENSSDFVEKEMQLEGIQMKILEKKDAKQAVIFCPGFPESKGFNDQLIDYVSKKYGVSCVYPQYTGTRQSDGQFLGESPSADIEKIIQHIRRGDILTNSKIHITLIGSSFGGGVALSLSWNNDVGKVLALSPLTASSGTVDRESLYTYIAENRPEYRIDKKGYDKLKDGSLLKIPNKYPEGKVVVGAVQGDPEINFDGLIKESIKKSAVLLDKIALDENEKKHLSRSVINRLNEPTKEQIFNSLDIINEQMHFVDLFLTSLFEKVLHENVHGVLSHGSRLFKDKKERDFDFILIFNSVQKSDLEVLQHIRSKFLEQGISDLDITIVYMDKLAAGGIKNFNLSTHGNYYAEVLSTAKTLYGTNPFDGRWREEELTKNDVTQGFRREIGKYADRLNRDILHRQNSDYFKKYIPRMVLSFALAEGVMSVFKSNYFDSKDLPILLKRLGFEESYITALKSLLNKEFRDKNDRANCYYLYNQFHARSLEMTKLSVPNSYLSSTLSKICDITDNVSISCSNEKIDIIEPSIKIISCAGFEKGSWNKLEANQEKINSDQLNKLAHTNIVLQQIRQYFRVHFGKAPQTEILFGDYGVNATNKEELSHQYIINEKVCNKILGNIRYRKLSDDLGSDTYNKSDNYTLETIKEIMGQYGLEEDFINGYTQGYHMCDQNVLNMIGSSITEHLNLISKIIDIREHSILIYIGNSQKIRLMNEVIKHSKHNNILVGINT